MNTSVGHARAMARKLIKKYNIQAPPVGVRDIIAGEKVVLEFVSYKNDTAGESWRELGIERIRINKAHSLNRQRFSMGHELGHLTLKHSNHQFRNFSLPAPQAIPAHDEDTGDGPITAAAEIAALNAKDPNEVEANQFAAELLMPWSMFKKDLNAGMDIPALARRYQVSEEAAGWRAHTILVGR